MFPDSSAVSSFTAPLTFTAVITGVSFVPVMTTVTVCPTDVSFVVSPLISFTVMV